ncbi:EamA family transporter [Nocardioides sp. TRM66260-LWL]|uniref:EamA family transporter n=1 Tax=Nocardioides sp. TRM66260-LWL TaxID=2874478 RepID=UPI001CC5041C|nr:EamA family transporter [Nocardioides sp. TRM66260-LWL]MBZ5735260.1 EamA family transporter [Nocardioides sp. TRM66260-LWL]
MISEVVAAVAGAGAAAVLFAGSAALQQSAGRVADGTPAPGGVRAALATRRWWAGWLLNVGGFALQAWALRRASVEVVQPVVSLQVVVALLLAARQLRRRPTVPAIVAALALCAGAFVLVGVVGPRPPLSAAADARLPLLLGAVALGAVALAGVGLAALARDPRPGRGPLLLALATGLCCASTAVLLDVVADAYDPAAPPALLLGWPAYALLVSVVASTLVGQRALAAGHLPWTIATLTVVTPLASLAIARLAAQDAPTTAAQAAGIGGASALMLLGALGLARSDAPPRAADVSTLARRIPRADPAHALVDP